MARRDIVSAARVDAKRRKGRQVGTHDEDEKAPQGGAERRKGDGEPKKGEVR